MDPPEVLPPSSPIPSSLAPSPPSPPGHLSDADRLRRVINELVETERSYVQDLTFLMDHYLTPLQDQKLLTDDQLEVLSANVAEMLDFQTEFLKTLEDGIRLVPDLERLETVKEFKRVFFSLGGSFLYYSDRFKLYSDFCSAHTKVPKVLESARGRPSFVSFLAERNPGGQHSSSLESFLIKPIQRILKYPLLLTQLLGLARPESEEHYHLTVAVEAMNKVASHINEMQKVHEEFGNDFDQLINEQTGEKKEVSDLSMGDLLFHSSVVWINPLTSLSRNRKELHLAAFVFRSAVVFVQNGELKSRRRMGSSHRVSISDESLRFRHMIPTDALQLRNHTDCDVVELVHCHSDTQDHPETSFQLSCSSSVQRDLLKAVHRILREKQRRLLMKTEAPPPRRQYAPFGGKRLCALKGSRPAFNRAASTPSRSVGRRRLTRNGVTFDSDVVFDGSDDVITSRQTTPPSQDAPLQPIRAQGAESEQGFPVHQSWDSFDDIITVHAIMSLDVRETDILSDGDDFCQSAKAARSALEGAELRDSAVMDRQ